MTNATPTPDTAKTINDLRQTIAAQTKTLAEKQAELDTANSAFLEMIKTAGSGMDAAAQLAIADKRTAAAAAVETAQKLLDGSNARLSSLTKTQRMAALEPEAVKMKEIISRTLAGFGAKMAAADAGSYLSIFVEFGDDGNVKTVSHAYRQAGAVKTGETKPRATGSRGTAKEIVADGVSYEASAYVEKFWADAVAAGYKTTRASFADVPKNEYSKIAVRFAELLSHSYQDKAPTTEAPTTEPAETPAEA